MQGGLQVLRDSPHKPTLQPSPRTRKFCSQIMHNLKSKSNYLMADTDS